MLKSYTFWFTLAAAAICAFHYAGYDHNDAVLFHSSIPAWILPAFLDIHTLNLALVYVLTIGSWTLVGLFADQQVERAAAARRKWKYRR